MTPLEETLATLVDIPSETGQEGRICTAIAERMLPTYELIGVRRIGNSLVVGRRGGRPLVTMYGHLDTVPEQGNGTARIEGPLMHGLGTTDMKGGLAVMIHLLEDKAVQMGPFDVIGVFYDMEEGPADDNGLEEVLLRNPWLVESQLGVVMEPTDLKLELGCNGAMNADVVFTGKAAHSARPWMGENAITKAGAWLDRLHAMAPELVVLHGLEYREVFSVTKASGGIANNVLPAAFTLNLNYRFPPIYDLQQAESRLLEVAAGADEIQIKDKAPAGKIPEGNELLERLEGLVGGDIAAKQGWTDVARLSAHGIPSVNYGPGQPLLAHQAEESIPLANLATAYDTMYEFLTTH
jgi:succinyl-diaminopimelate desuccinylase